MTNNTTLTFQYSPAYDRFLLQLINRNESDSFFEKRRTICNEFSKTFVPENISFLEQMKENMSKTLGIENNQKITIYVIPSMPRSGLPSGFSDPLTISLARTTLKGEQKYTPEQLICLITHEIAHHIQHPLRKTSYSKTMKKIYPEMLIRNHLLTYALLISVLPPDLFKIEEKKAQKQEQYKKALEIVQKTGAESIITNARQHLHHEP